MEKCLSNNIHWQRNRKDQGKYKDVSHRRSASTCHHSAMERASGPGWTLGDVCEGQGSAGHRGAGDRVVSFFLSVTNM